MILSFAAAVFAFWSFALMIPITTALNAKAPPRKASTDLMVSASGLVFRMNALRQYVEAVRAAQLLLMPTSTRAADVASIAVFAVCADVHVRVVQHPPSVDIGGELPNTTYN
jgi:hypothetical protein